MKELFKKISQIALASAIVVVFTLIANAFTEPTQAPPGGNVSAPLNTSATTQTKTGKLLFTWFEDYDQPGYYSDPGGNSMFYRLYGLADIRAPIFYDQDNTSYYANPSGESSFNSASFSGAIAANAGISVDGYTAISDGNLWHNTYGNGGWYNGTYAGGWNMEDTTWVRSYNNKSVYTGGQVRGDAGLCIGTDCRTSWPTGPGVNVYSCPDHSGGGRCGSGYIDCIGQLTTQTYCDFWNCTWQSYSCSYVGRLVQ